MLRCFSFYTLEHLMTPKQTSQLYHFKTEVQLKFINVCQNKRFDNLRIGIIISS
jgi:hypothetical protein